MAKNRNTSPADGETETHVDAIAGVMAEDELQARADAEQNAVSAAGAPVHTPESKPHSNLKFTRTRTIAMPLFKLVADTPRFFLADGAMFIGKQIDDKKEAATLMAVTDLETGEQGQIIIGQVLKELLIEQYPENGYVGKRFELCLRKRADKKYNTYDLFEVAAQE